jgi:L-ascorbate metabolism protein UlaG (beta-lactamase superfamily)
MNSISRRRFLDLLALFAASVHSLPAQETRRSRLDLITNNDETSPAPFVPEPLSWSDDTITACWIGHATVLVNFFGVNIITDPVFSNRVGLNFAGLFTVGPKRLVAPALTFEQLPRIDLILFSHAHMDHLDLPSVKQFDRNIPLVMAPNTSDVVADFDFKTVYELDWGKWTNVAGLRVEALRVQHFGWRFPWEDDRSKGNMEGRSYNAYLLSRNGRHIVFGGDTAYQQYFGELSSRKIDVDLAMMPIGCYDPWIRNHANPEQAIAMADQMGAASILPMHWGTFIQSDEPVQEPIRRLRLAAASHLSKIALESVGQTWSLKHGGVIHTAPRQGG